MHYIQHARLDRTYCCINDGSLTRIQVATCGHCTAAGLLDTALVEVHWGVELTGEIARLLTVDYSLVYQCCFVLYS